ncbi:sigma-70 family RNA polymerase sigma factor [Salinibacterium soli]|uniref:Sigma-70 family RNA polymerase sigma factor n=1 Tax=Antiquaquibacter soli TaxID=3064523 RepID=A0ABT9BKB9_9MICO|nr:sigma-70 family RNA polymerase sigma factor [Protaetiibacter sp. WY-16]MDO7881004.1 sigma-70 family RNA polymerase sigma factor [Protaetiibacter sp. WY-16]
MAGDAEDVADAVLIRQARSGDARAFGRLWNRHHTAALRFATRLVGRSDSEDLVSDAFASIYQAIRNGAGPDEMFRPYLYTTLKNLSIRWSIRESAFTLEEVDFDTFTDSTTAEDEGVAALERSYEALAFRSLPHRWQEVLWYGEVEGLKPRDIAPILGMSANAVAALAYRARDGFRKAWLELRAQDDAAVSAPSDKVLAGRLRAVLVPLLVGIPLAEFLRDTGGSAPATAAVTTASSHLPIPTFSGLIAGATAIGAASVLVAAAIIAPPEPGTSPTLEVPASASAPLPGYGEPERPGGDPAPVEPTRDPASTDPTRTEPPTSPPLPTTPAALPAATTPAVFSPLAGEAVPGGAVAVSGSGDSGSEILFTIDGQSAGSVIVDQDGSWHHDLVASLADGAHELGVVQRSATRSSSPIVSIPFTVDSVAPAQPLLATTFDRYAQSAPPVSGVAEPGAIVVVSDGVTELARVTADDDGSWSTPSLEGLTAYSTQLVVTQIDRAGNASDAAITPLAFTPRFTTTQTQYPASWLMWPVLASGWPGASVRTYIDGQPVWTNYSLITTIPASGNFQAYQGGFLSAGVHVITIAYADPTTLEPLSTESFTVTVTP